MNRSLSLPFTDRALPSAIHPGGVSHSRPARWARDSRPRKQIAFAAAAVLYGGMAGLGSGSLAEAVGCAVPILTAGFVILYLYNGQRARRGRNFSKWFFYTFYPAHLLVLGLIRILA